jgi:predicted GIY-YIG superfamily endonuclease
MNRKKRNDRNHIVYEIVNTITGSSYIGVTAAIGRRFNYSAKLRLQKHFSRARKENKNWALYNDMREYGQEVYDLFIVKIVRGKAAAHQYETKQLQMFHYELNSTH